ncbi:hypothetical protein WJX74_009102 [Apatococcus lobatus]|uniref:1-deoxy-D-xylulose-5-phosphate synthase n=1 Tax=Apatococcus lobatus TaxID=904363 RepID=A0AAW1R3P1_9CHLO
MPTSLWNLANQFSRSGQIPRPLKTFQSQLCVEALSTSAIFRSGRRSASSKRQASRIQATEREPHRWSGQVQSQERPGLGIPHWDKLSADEIQDWGGKPRTPLLDTVSLPIHMKKYDPAQLQQLCRELRSEIIHSVSSTGGHLGSSLGVIELTVALHYIFNCPEDKIIWDAGHQAYGHKILTGRRHRMSTLRQTGGLSGFPMMSESKYDTYGSGHTSISVSAALGMAVGRDLKGRDNHCIAVIGDGGITGGMCYEAMNHAGLLDRNLIVILNDNQQVSLPTQYNEGNQDPVGAVSAGLARLQSSKPSHQLQEIPKEATKQLPAVVQEAIAKLNVSGHGIASAPGSTLFEELGLRYIGPIDGHNLQLLLDILTEVKATETVGPVLIHVITQKGYGYLPAESALDRMHGVGKFEPVSGKQQKAAASKAGSYANHFADALIAEAEQDSRVVGIHAAMGGGTGMNRFESKFPDRTFDVGIAEQHAVTFAAALATEGIVPFAAIYSTFLQRGFDQVVHDVCLQSLPVRFAMDRAGMVGADGATHCGFADIAYMGCLPNMVLMAPSNEAELCNAVATAKQIDDRPSCFRFPRGNGLGVDLKEFGVQPNFKGMPWEIGKGVVRQCGSDVCLLGYGTCTNQCLEAADLLVRHGVSTTIVDMRFCKPLDTQLLTLLAKEHEVMVSVEEGAIGGFASHVLHALALQGLLDSKLKFRPMILPDRFIEHGSSGDQMAEAGLTASHIAATCLTLLGRQRESLQIIAPLQPPHVLTR